MNTAHSYSPRECPGTIDNVRTCLSAGGQVREGRKPPTVIPTGAVRIKPIHMAGYFFEVGGIQYRSYLKEERLATPFPKDSPAHITLINFANDVRKERVSKGVPESCRIAAPVVWELAQESHPLSYSLRRHEDGRVYHNVWKLPFEEVGFHVFSYREAWEWFFSTRGYQTPPMGEEWAMFFRNAGTTIVPAEYNEGRFWIVDPGQLPEILTKGYPYA
ncbi:MAG TPA: hypothetical protein VJB93_04175 [Patescibacteria group bacterium]|nr:hypothetical protein [Patescibacteria group bacterium]